MKPQNFLNMNVDASILAKELGVTSRQVRKARQGKQNAATEAIDCLDAKQRGQTAVKLHELQESTDRNLWIYRHPKEHAKKLAAKKKGKKENVEDSSSAGE